jgi:uncharacterized protein YjbI with pentapeptide repeats
MIEIKHNKSGNVFLQLETDSLVRANLMGEYLIHADLNSADLTSAKMAFVNLSGADLTNANLSGANLRGANLTEANMTGTDFAGADLTGATFSLTVLTACRNLHQAVGLAKIQHPNPSELDEQTLRASAALLPDAFLQGAGYTRSEIAYFRRMYPAQPEGAPE